MLCLLPYSLTYATEGSMRSSMPGWPCVESGSWPSAVVIDVMLKGEQPDNVQSRAVQYSWLCLWSRLQAPMGRFSMGSALGITGLLSTLLLMRVWHCYRMPDNNIGQRCNHALIKGAYLPRKLPQGWCGGLSEWEECNLELGLARTPCRPQTAKIVPCSVSNMSWVAAIADTVSAMGSALAESVTIYCVWHLCNAAAPITE